MEEIFELMVTAIITLSVALIKALAYALYKLTLLIYENLLLPIYNYIDYKLHEKQHKLKEQEERKKQEEKQRKQDEEKKQQELEEQKLLALQKQKQARIEQAEKLHQEEQLKFYNQKKEAENPKQTEFRKAYYLENKLKKEQLDALYAKDFKRIKISPYGNSGSAYYWVKTRYNESAEHAFFCYLIRDELKNYSKKITLNINNGPDIVFTHKKKNYCIDVETGKNLKRNPLYVKNKFAKYAREHEQSFIFVTKKKLKYSYAKHGTILTRSTLRKTLEQLFK